MQAKEKNVLLVLFILITFGLIQVYSSSYIFAVDKYGDGLLFFKKQLFFVALGCGVLLTLMKIPFQWIEKWGWTVWAVAVIGLLLTFIPGVGVRVGGAQRWIPLGFGFRFEPCELMKVSLPLILATFASQREDQWGRWTWPLRALVVMGPIGLLLLQPDFGSFTICIMVLATILFAFGLPWRYIIAGSIVAAPTFYFLVMSVPYRRARVLAFLDPFKNPESSGFQLIQSMLSFHSGGFDGAGLGNGQGKLFFLPAAHTDFTLAVLGEELGFIGFVLLLAAYGYLVFRSFQLAFSLKTVEKQVLALGLTTTFAYSVFVNVGVTLGLLPTKGLTLPFLSYGGSSLVINCFLFGILLNLLANYKKTLTRRRRRRA
ncbi:MAG: putative lipid II flippase FtsW [Bdellovibrionales bacterium]|nr:putative lipid II flippase FtsW [Bdellovibrionales bacterium]NQZ19424.1 putative lipid II flippase FtsW [Bdellovibrionales bacterium]